MGNQIVEWINSNKEWLFSGVGISLILLVFGIFRWMIRKPKRESAIKPEQELKAGDKSSNIQAGRDVIMTNVPLGTRTENQIYPLSFKEIYKKVGSVSPDQMAKVARKYEGITIRWETRFCSLDTKKNRTPSLLSLWIGESTTMKVYCWVAQENYPELKILEENTRIILQGEIQLFQGEIQEVTDLKIIFYNAILSFPEANKKK